MTGPAGWGICGPVLRVLVRGPCGSALSLQTGVLLVRWGELVNTGPAVLVVLVRVSDTGLRVMNRPLSGGSQGIGLVMRGFQIVTGKGIVAEMGLEASSSCDEGYREGF